MRLKLLLSLVISFYQLSASRATTFIDQDLNSIALPDQSVPCGALMVKLDYLQYKLFKLDFAIKEQMERIEENLEHLEKVFGGIGWTLNQVEQAIGHNLTALQSQSEKILFQQIACANHERIRNEMFNLVPKPRLSEDVSSVLEMDSFRRKGPFGSCREEPSKVSGKYLIRPEGDSEPFEAYCEQTKFGGGWLVIQQRFDGSLDFFRNWTEYRNGFGSLDREFWFGLERIHQLTRRSTHQLIVEVEAFDGDQRYARYTEFEIGNEKELYKLKKLGAFSGTAGDSLTYHKGWNFTTVDKDNDGSASNCAVTSEGAWWYNNCHHSNLNGRYWNVVDVRAISWHKMKNTHQGMAYSRMLIRAV
uniref:Fibrinogen C-terminal domain-containing protein n=1 Tax=Anopheles atroparvus TaxID=41427 RepID=A0AAG5DLH7_ANOAO